MHAAMERAVERARKDKHPTLLEVRTYRFMGHSMSDPIHGHYRTREEVEDQRKRDPIAVWSQRLIEDGLMDQAAVKAMDEAVMEEVDDAYQFAEEAPDPEPEASCTRTCMRDREARVTSRRQGCAMPTLTYRDALNQALREEMQRDADVFLMGEEVGVYQGAYKVSRGLLDEFGPMRVVDTPDHRARLRRRRRRRGDGRPPAGHRVHDLELRAPRHRPARQLRRQDALHVGRAGRRADRVPRPGRRRAAARRAALAGVRELLRPHPRPQGRHAGHAGRRQGPAQERHPRRQPGGLHRGRDALQHQGRGARRRARRAARQGRRQARRAATSRSSATRRRWPWRSRPPSSSPAEEVDAEVVDLRTIRPLDTEAMLASVAKTHRCVVAEEGWPFAGVGAQVVDTIQREAFDELDAPVLRVTSADVPMPYDKHLEKAAKVDPARVDRRGAHGAVPRLSHGNQGRHGGALAHDGGGAPRRVEEGRGRRRSPSATSWPRSRPTRR